MNYSPFSRLSFWIKLLFYWQVFIRFTLALASEVQFCDGDLPEFNNTHQRLKGEKINDQTYYIYGLYYSNGDCAFFKDYDCISYSSINISPGINKAFSYELKTFDTRNQIWRSSRSYYQLQAEVQTWNMINITRDLPLCQTFDAVKRILVDQEHGFIVVYGRSPRTTIHGSHCDEYLEVFGIDVGRSEERVDRAIAALNAKQENNQPLLKVPDRNANPHLWHVFPETGCPTASNCTGPDSSVQTTNRRLREERDTNQIYYIYGLFYTGEDCQSFRDYDCINYTSTNLSPPDTLSAYRFDLQAYNTKLHAWNSSQSFYELQADKYTWKMINITRDIPMCQTFDVVKRILVNDEKGYIVVYGRYPKDRNSEYNFYLEIFGIQAGNVAERVDHAIATLNAKQEDGLPILQDCSKPLVYFSKGTL